MSNQIKHNEKQKTKKAKGKEKRGEERKDSILFCLECFRQQIIGLKPERISLYKFNLISNAFYDILLHQIVFYSMNISKQSLICLFLFVSLLYRTSSITTFTLVSTANLTTYSEPTYNSYYTVDACLDFSIKSKAIYRLGQNNVFQFWNKSNLMSNPINQTAFIGVTSSGNYTLDINLTQFYVTDAENQVIFLPLYGVIRQDLQSNTIINFEITSISDNIIGMDYRPNKYIFFANDDGVDTQISTYGAGMNVSLNDISVNAQFSVSNVSNGNYLVSPNHETIILWNNASAMIQIYNLDGSNSLSLIKVSFVNESVSAINTDVVAFSSDSHLLVSIALDNVNIIRILDVSLAGSFREFRFVHNGTTNHIMKILFLDRSNLNLAVFEVNTIFVYNTSDLAAVTLDAIISLELPILPMHQIQFDSASNQLYICTQNAIRLFTIVASTVNSTTTNTTANNTTMNLTSTNNSSTLIPSNSSHLFEVDDKSRINLKITALNLNNSKTASDIISSITSGLTITNTLAGNFIAIITVTPFIYFFLNFINFFTISSLYILSAISIPDVVYEPLLQIYKLLNENILSIFNVQLTIPQYSDQKCDSTMQYYNISSDFISNNTENLMLMVVVIAVFQIIKFMTRNSKKRSLFYSFTKIKRFHVFSGLIVSILVNLILPWSSISTSIPNLNWKTKLNEGAQYILFFFGLLFPFLFVTFYVSMHLKIEQTIMESKIEIPQVKICMQSQSILIKKWFIKKAKHSYKKNQKKYVLMSAKQCKQFKAVLVNVIYPLSVLLNPAIFLIIGSIYCILNVVSSAYLQKWKANQIILSLYPLLYHLCFVVFYIVNDNDILIYTSIVCLIVLFLGALHELLTNLTENAINFYSFIKFKCTQKNAIAPNSDMKIRIARLSDQNLIQIQNQQSIAALKANIHKQNIKDENQHMIFASIENGIIKKEEIIKKDKIIKKDEVIQKQKEVVIKRQGNAIKKKVSEEGEKIKLKIKKVRGPSALNIQIIYK